VQTYLSSHHAIQAVAQNDESVFLSEELSYRTALEYPPAVYLISLLVSGINEKMVRDAATAWVARLTACASSSIMQQAPLVKTPSPTQSIGRPGSLTILGPVPSPVSRLRGRYRWQILVKSFEREAGLEAVRITVKEMERTYQRRAMKFDVDVDPIEMW
jgi:primosomal protein N' (replication factor Y)